MRAFWAVLLVFNIASENSLMPAQPATSGLDTGIQQIKDGHFDAALLTLDGVVRQIGTSSARKSETTSSASACLPDWEAMRACAAATTPY